MTPDGLTIHGWQFAADGTILETPGEPAGSTLKDRLYHGAYPTHEYNGIVFAYLGPPDQQPVFPMYDSFVRTGYRLMPGRNYFYPCTWLQIMPEYRDFAERAGNPVISEARLMMAERLDQEAGRFETSSVSTPDRSVPSEIDGTAPSRGSVHNEASADADRPAPKRL